jgi:hypothetical protein
VKSPEAAVTLPIAVSWIPAPAYKLPAIPAPPLTINAPVALEEAGTVLLTTMPPAVVKLPVPDKFATKVVAPYHLKLNPLVASGTLVHIVAVSTPRA